MVVKRALPKLRVRGGLARTAGTRGGRSRLDRTGRGIDPHWVPKILGEDRARHLFAMEYLPPEKYPLWKAELAAGRIDHRLRRAVGAALAHIHAATAGRVRRRRMPSPMTRSSIALRLEPYLLFTAERHPDLAPVIRDVVDGDRKIAHRADAGRHQSQEHSVRTGWPGVSRRRDGLLWRSGVRSRLLPQPLPAQERLASANGAIVTPSAFERDEQVLSRGRHLGSRRRDSTGAPRGCCRCCSWRASTANRRSNISPRRKTRRSCAPSRAR